MTYSISHHIGVPTIFKMPYTKRYSRRRGRRGKRSFKSSVANVVHSLAESKTLRREIKGDVPLTTFSPSGSLGSNYFYRTFSPNAEIIESANVNARVGKEIFMKGVRFEMVFDNTNTAAVVPVYLTLLVVMTTLDDSPENFLFRSYGPTRAAFSLPATATDEFKHEMHTLPINTTRYKVISRSALRLGCKGEPDLPGPRFSQRIAYFPINKKCRYDDSTGVTNIKPQIHFIVLASNPTQLTQGTATNMKYEINSVLYYKDM